MFLGTKDDLIPVATGEEYDRRMKAVGSPSELHLYKDATHGFLTKAARAIITPIPWPRWMRYW